MKINQNFNQGQALVTLLFFIIVAITIASAATVIIVINSMAATKFQEGSLAYYVAESGMENAILRFLRDPVNYTSESVPISGGTAAITVISGNPVEITSVGTLGNFSRKIRVQVNNFGGTYTISSWKEIY